MKTLVLVACLLAVTSAVDLQEAKHFYELIRICSFELHLPYDAEDPKVFKCVGDKLGLYNKQDELLIYKLIKYVDNIILDYNKHGAITLILQCDAESKQGTGSNNEKAIQSIQCAIKHGLLKYIINPY